MTDRPDTPGPGGPQDGDDSALAAEYALGLLSAAEARDFETRMATDPALRALYAEWAEDLAGLTAELPEVEPPATLRGHVETTLFPPAAAEPRKSRRGFLWFGLGGLAAAAAAVVALRVDVSPEPALQATIAAEDDSLVVLAALDPAEGLIAVDRRTGQAAAGRALELWLIAGQDAPVSLGLLPEGGEGVLTLDPALLDRLEGAILAISDEPPGGSPTGQPTGAVLATGAIVSAAG